MKKIIIVASLFAGILQADRIATTKPKPVGVDRLLGQATGIAKSALDLAENNKEAGCGLMTQFGAGLGIAFPDEENRKVAAAQCCDYWRENGIDTEHPKAYDSLCGTPKTLREYIGDAAKFTLEAPAVRCPVSAKLGTDLAKLPKAEREKMCKACGSRWPKDSKAKFAVCGMQGEKLPKDMELEDLDFPEDDEEAEGKIKEEEDFTDLR